jgi:hypothetical protein
MIPKSLHLLLQCRIGHIPNLAICQEVSLPPKPKVPHPCVDRGVCLQKVLF